MPQSQNQAAEIMALRLEIKKLEYVSETLKQVIDYTKDKPGATSLYIRALLSNNYHKDFLDTYNELLNEY